jgi:hypothetical protein
MMTTNINDYEDTDTASMVMYKDVKGQMRQLDFGSLEYNLDVIKRPNDIKADLKEAGLAPSASPFLTLLQFNNKQENT